MGWVLAAPVCAVGAGVAAITNTLIIGIAWVFLEVASLILYLASALLNGAVFYGVMQFATYFGSSPGIQAGWIVLRDVGNILLIFSFVFIGIATILGLESYGVKKALPRLLIFAVLLNFSLFAASIVVDVSNVLATSIYQASGACVNATDAQGCVNNGISTVITTHLSIGTLFNWSALKNIVDGSGKQLTAMIMVTLFVMITATTLLAAAILFIIRIVVLVFVLVVSPVGFAGIVVPPLKKFATQWWETLFAQSFFAPVYLLLILISLKVAESFASAGSGSSNGDLLAAIAGGSTSSMQVFITFAIIIGFMLAALMSAKKLGAYGAAFAVKQASWAPKMVAGFGWRNTVGVGSHVVKGAYDRIVGRWKPTTRFGRFGHGLYMNTVDAAVGGALKAGTEKGVFGAASYAKARKAVEERKAETTKAADKAENEAKLKQAMEDLGDPDPLKKSEAEKTLAQILQKMTLSELKETKYLKYMERNTADLDKIAKTMSPERFANLMNDKDFPADKQNALRAARFKDIQGMMANPDELRKRLKQIGIKDAENMDPAMLTDDRFIDAMGEGLAEDVLKSQNIAAPLRDEIRQKRDARFKSDDPEKIERLMKTLEPGQWKKIDPAVLFDEKGKLRSEIGKNLSDKIMDVLDTNEKLTQPYRDAIEKWSQNIPDGSAYKEKIETRKAGDPFFAKAWGGTAEFTHQTRGQGASGPSLAQRIQNPPRGNRPTR